MSTKRQRGLTIIELVMFMVIMGVAAAGIIGVLNIGGSKSADPVRRKQALMIAEAFMEEVQTARFTFCEPNDPNAATAASQGACATPVAIGIVAGELRPYGNLAHYAASDGVANRSFAVGGVDRDINGRALGQDAGLNTLGNSSLAGITTMVTLSTLSAGALPGSGLLPLGPPGRTIASAANSLNVLRITITTRYGTGTNDFIQLDGYRTRYAPTYLP
jgi:MSHA pilin protein MshD